MQESNMDKHVEYLNSNDTHSINEDIEFIDEAFLKTTSKLLIANKGTLSGQVKRSKS